MRFLAHTGLALATSISALLNATLLGYGLFKQHIYTLQSGWGRFALQLLLALSAMATVIEIFNPELTVWFSMSLTERIVTLFALIMSSGLIYVVTLFLAGLRKNHILAKSISEGEA